jgi:hypothetical protein
MSAEFIVHLTLMSFFMKTLGKSLSEKSLVLLCYYVAIIISEQISVGKFYRKNKLT